MGFTFGFNTCVVELGVDPKIGVFPPKMDGENHGLNPMYKRMIWGVFNPLFSESTSYFSHRATVAIIFIFTQSRVLEEKYQNFSDSGMRVTSLLG